MTESLCISGPWSVEWDNNSDLTGLQGEANDCLTVKGSVQRLV